MGSHNEQGLDSQDLYPEVLFVAFQKKKKQTWDDGTSRRGDQQRVFSESQKEQRPQWEGGGWDRSEEHIYNPAKKVS